jgi:tight adherence protein C
LNAALAKVVENVPGILSSEVSRMLQEIQLGSSRSDAFRHLGERTDVEELNAFILAMIQADIFGVSISNVLRGQAKELRTKRRQRAEREAQQTPVKIVFPLILCVLPSLFIVVIGPGAIRIFQNLLHH